MSLFICVMVRSNILDIGRYFRPPLHVVYNMRVEEYHTYFVGSAEWGFSVWVHNACSINELKSKPPTHPEYEAPKGWNGTR